jgi:hypothetical protein
MRHLAVECERFDFLRRKEEPMAGLAKHSEIATGIIFENDGKVVVVVEIALDGLDDSDFALERHVHDVG